MSEPSQAEPFVVDVEVEELEARTASAISANLAQESDLTLIALLTIYSLL
jgi:hypothetical protein